MRAVNYLAFILFITRGFPLVLLQLLPLSYFFLPLIGAFCIELLLFVATSVYHRAIQRPRFIFIKVQFLVCWLWVLVSPGSAARTFL